ncbi:hypothetical protein Droror1_Dr00022574 [Drosera rotundifolia]
MRIRFKINSHRDDKESEEMMAHEFHFRSANPVNERGLYSQRRSVVESREWYRFDCRRDVSDQEEMEERKVSRFIREIVVSSEARARWRASAGEKARSERPREWWPEMETKGVVKVVEWMRAMVSAEAEARREPSGENFREETTLEWGDRV